MGTTQAHQRAQCDNSIRCDNRREVEHTGGVVTEPPPPIVILVYDGAAGDEAGAMVEVMGNSGLEVIIASVEANPVTSYHGRLVPRRSATELGTIGALLVPGGMGVRSAAENEPLLAAVRHLGAGATWLGASSTGSVILTAAGMADNARVTTHWLAGDMITGRGVELVEAPFVEHGRLLTAAGLASSATLGFRLVGALLGSEAERMARARYQPSPPSDDRYERRQPWWRRIGQKRVSQSHPVDPTGLAEVVILDLD